MAREVGAMIEQNHTADPRIVAWLEAEAAGTKHCVDFGCGVGTYTSHIPAARIRSGVDIHRPFLERCTDDSLDLVQGSMCQWETLELGKFDTAVFIDSIEHVIWNQARRLLMALQARHHVRRILVFGPAGYHPQIDHKATLHPDDFKKMGFRVVVDENFHSTRAVSRAAFFAVFKKPGRNPL